MRYILLMFLLTIYVTACKKQDVNSYQRNKTISIDSFDDKNRDVYTGSMHEVNSVETDITLDTTYEYTISVVADYKDSSITFYDKHSVFTGIYKINSTGEYGALRVSGDSLNGHYSHGSMQSYSYSFHGKKTSI